VLVLIVDAQSDAANLALIAAQRDRQPDLARARKSLASCSV